MQIPLVMHAYAYACTSVLSVKIQNLPEIALLLGHSHTHCYAPKGSVCTL